MKTIAGVSVPDYVSPPICTTHNTPMNPPKKGDPVVLKWYCPKKVGDGYCDQKSLPIVAALPPNGTSPSPVPAGLTEAVDPVTEAMRFAASVYEGSHDGIGALELFVKALEIARRK